MARRDRRTAAPRFEEEPAGGGLALDTAHALPPTGPHDGDALDPEVTEAGGLVDFGSIRVPVPPEGTVTVEPTAGGRMQAVHVALPEGRLSVSALAAPKTSKLWPELAGEIDASLRESGARVRSFPGEWGRELHAISGGATSVFVGVDGARWMLYGVATGPTTNAESLDAELRRMLRGTVVMRGKQPYPVRTILPLTVPDHIAAEAEAAPAVTASKKRSAAKQGAAKPGAAKSAPGKTAPANPDAATAAAKKAARRAAARKAAATAAVKAAAEALAEQVAEDRAAAAAQERDSRPSHTSGTGPHTVRGTIPTGPGPDAPLREQAPSARRAAASAWRSRPAAAGWEAPPPTEAIPVSPPASRPVSPPVEEQPVTEAIPVAPAAAADLPPTEALRRVEPGSGGRRRLREAGPAADLPPGGRRHLQEPQAEDSFPGRRPRGPEAPLGAAASWDPYEAERPRRRHEPPPAAPGRRQPEPTAGGAPWETGPDGLDATGARRSYDPHGAVGADSAVSSTGRRRLRESWDDAEPVAPVADSGVSASGRRRLREPWGGPGPDATGALRPGEPPADSAVSSTGRRRLHEPWAGAEPVAPADSGVSSTGRRWSEEPRRRAESVRPSADSAAVSSTGRRRSDEPWARAEPVAPSADSGVSSTGRRRLRESWDAAPVADSGVSASGRRRLQESWEGSGPDGYAAPRPSEPPARAGGEPWEAGPGPDVSGTGRRHLREPWEDTAVPLHGTGSHDGVSATGRRHLAQPRGPAFDSGVSSTGRRRLRESWEDTGPRAADLDAGVSASGRRRLREPEDDALLPAGPPPWEDRPGPGADLLSGTGGRRPRGEPDLRGEPERAPEHRPAGPDATVGRRAARRHAEEGDGSPTVRLDALLAELDPNRPRRRHRRAQ